MTVNEAREKAERMALEEALEFAMKLRSDDFGHDCSKLQDAESMLLCDLGERALSTITKLKRQNEIMKAALVFYADIGNYVFHSPTTYYHAIKKVDIVAVRGGVAEDDGIKARQALKEIEKEADCE